MSWPTKKDPERGYADMPAFFHPNIEAFKTLGFRFAEPAVEIISAKCILPAVLPPGWCRALSDFDTMWDGRTERPRYKPIVPDARYIMDERGNHRVEYFEARDWRHPGHAQLLCRFQPHMEKFAGGGIARQSIFDVELSLRIREFPPQLRPKKGARPYNVIWLDVNLPQWEDPLAYWGDKLQAYSTMDDPEPADERGRRLPG